MKTRILSPILAVKKVFHDVRVYIRWMRVGYQMLTGASFERLRNFA